MAGFFDGAFDPQTYNSGILPGWLVQTLQNTPPEQLMKGLQTLMAGGAQQQPPQDPAALPPNAQPAMGQAPPGMGADPRMSIFTPRDGYAGDPPLNPMQGMPGMGAPGAGAMAQAPMQAPQGPMGAPQPPAQGGGMGGFHGAMSGIGDVLDSVRGLVHPGFGHRAGTADALVKMGIDPQVAQAMSRDKNLMSVAGGSLLGTKSTDDIKEFEYAKKNGAFGGTFEQWMQKKRATSGEYGMQPIYGLDKDGKTVVLQLGKSGDMIQSKMPGDVTLSPGVEKIDLGTEWGLYDKKAGALVGRVPKDVRGKEREGEIGKVQGVATTIIPQVETTVKNAMKTIGELRSHPGLDVGTGLSSKIDPRSWVPGQPGYDFIAKNKQAQGQSFMAAREALKGAGQVTDFEGMKGEQAITNLDTAQSKEQYLDALKTLEQMMQSSLSDLKKKAGVTSAAPAAASPVNSLKSKYGLE